MNKSLCCFRFYGFQRLIQAILYPTKPDFLSCSYDSDTQKWADSGICGKAFGRGLLLAALSSVLCYVFSYKLRWPAGESDGLRLTNLKQLYNCTWLVIASYGVIGLLNDSTYYAMSKVFDDSTYQAGNAVMYVVAALMTGFTIYWVENTCLLNLSTSLAIHTIDSSLTIGCRFTRDTAVHLHICECVCVISF